MARKQELIGQLLQHDEEVKHAHLVVSTNHGLSNEANSLLRVTAQSSLRLEKLLMALILTVLDLCEENGEDCEASGDDAAAGD